MTLWYIDGLELEVTPREWRDFKSGVCGVGRGYILTVRSPLPGIWRENPRSQIDLATSHFPYQNLNFPLHKMGTIQVGTTQGC